METIGRDRTQTISFTVRIAVLATITIGLAMQMFMAAEAAGGVEDELVRRTLARIAGLSVAMLGLTLVMLFWTVARYFRRRMGSGVHFGKTPYVDAWALAGKRFQLDETEEEPDEGDDEGEDDQADEDN